MCERSSLNMPRTRSSLSVYSFCFTVRGGKSNQVHVRVWSLWTPLCCIWGYGSAFSVPYCRESVPMDVVYFMGQILRVGTYTGKQPECIQEPHQTIGSSKMGGGCLHGDGCLLGTIRYLPAASKTTSGLVLHDRSHCWCSMFSQPCVTELEKCIQYTHNRCSQPVLWS